MSKMASRRHYSDEVLLAWLDGELPVRRRTAVREHLQTCWKCRAAAAGLEGQARELAKAWDRGLFPSREQMLAAEAEFARAVEHYERSSRLSAGPFFNRRIALRIAASVVVSLGVLLLWRPWRAPVPKAQEIIARAEQAETALLRRAAQQVFSVELAEVRPLARTAVSRLELWSDSETGRFASRWKALDGELKHATGHSGVRYELGSLRETADLEEVANGGVDLTQVERGFVRWLESASGRPVSLGRDLARFANKPGVALRVERIQARRGAEIFRVTATRQTAFLRTEFVADIETPSYRVRTVRVRFDSKGRAVIMQLSVEHAEPVSPALVAAAAGRPESRPFAPKPILPPPRRPRTPAPGPTELEVEVLFALHRVRACLGEPVEVRSSPGGGVLVRGIAPSVERMQQWVAALAPLSASPHLKIDIKTTEEALRELEPPRQQAEIISHPSSGARRAPLQGALEAYFATRPEAHSHGLAGFTDEAVTRAEAILSEAWALRRLAERFAARPPDGLSLKSQWLWEAMAREHLADLAKQAVQTRALLEPFFSFLGAAAEPVAPETAASGASTTWEAALIQVFQHSRRLHGCMLAVFTGAGASIPAEELPGRLLEGLFNLEARLEEATGKLTSAFPVGARQYERFRRD